MLKRCANIITLLAPLLLTERLDQSNEYIKLAKIIDWASIENSLLKYYSKINGAMALPIRLMVGLLILKYLNNLSDEKVCQRWKTDHYFQAFTGNTAIQDTLPCDPSMLSVFRKRIGKGGIESIFKHSIKIFGKSVDKLTAKELIIDSTVQEKYTIYPNDIKLSIDVIKQVWKICDKNLIKLRSKHKKEVFKLRKAAAFNKSNRRNEIKTNILYKLRNIGIKLLKEMDKKLSDAVKITFNYEEMYKNYFKALTQEKNDKNKIYSIYEPQVYCISKGKANKKYEFGSKIGIIINKMGVIVAATNFETNMHDSKTIDPLLSCLDDNSLPRPEILIGDSGYRGRKYFGNTTVITPLNNLSKLSKPELIIYEQRMNRRSQVEAVISHVKLDFRAKRNELRGVLGDNINPLLSAAAYNFALFVRLEQKKAKKKKLSQILDIKKFKNLKNE
jgi:IS5 family transposase